MEYYTPLMPGQIFWNLEAGSIRLNHRPPLLVLLVQLVLPLVHLVRLSYLDVLSMIR